MRYKNLSTKAAQHKPENRDRLSTKKKTFTVRFLCAFFSIALYVFAGHRYLWSENAGYRQQIGSELKVVVASKPRDTGNGAYDSPGRVPRQGR